MEYKFLQTFFKLLPLCFIVVLFSDSASAMLLARRLLPNTCWCERPFIRSFKMLSINSKNTLTTSFKENNFIAFTAEEQSPFDKNERQQLLELVDHQGQPSCSSDTHCLSYYYAEQHNIYFKNDFKRKVASVKNWFNQGALASYVTRVISLLPQEQLEGVRQIRADTTIFDNYRQLVQKIEEPQSYYPDLLEYRQPALKFHQDFFNNEHQDYDFLFFLTLRNEKISPHNLEVGSVEISDLFYANNNAWQVKDNDLVSIEASFPCVPGAGYFIIQRLRASDKKAVVHSHSGFTLLLSKNDLESLKAARTVMVMRLKAYSDQ